MCSIARATLGEGWLLISMSSSLLNFSSILQNRKIVLRVIFSRPCAGSDLPILRFSTLRLYSSRVFDELASASPYDFASAGVQIFQHMELSAPSLLSSIERWVRKMKKIQSAAFGVPEYEMWWEGKGRPRLSPEHLRQLWKMKRESGSDQPDNISERSIRCILSGIHLFSAIN